MSRTVRVRTCSWVVIPQYSPKSGPSVPRARLGLSPTSPHIDDGMRIEPPMSLPCATATMPAATAAADPPLEPPGERLRSHGLYVGPYASGSVVTVGCELGRVRLADDDEPGGAEARRRATCRRARPSPPPSARCMPAVIGVARRCARPRPSAASARRGTARRAVVRPPRRAPSRTGRRSPRSAAGFSASTRASAASTSSPGVAAPDRTSSAWAVASSPAVSSVMTHPRPAVRTRFGGRSPREHRHDPVAGQAGHPSAGRLRRRTDVGQQHRARRGEEPRMSTRGSRSNTSRPAANSRAALERVGQRLLVDDRPPRRVHEHGRGSQQGEPAGVEQMVGVGRERDVQRHDVAGSASSGRGRPT